MPLKPPSADRVGEVRRLARGLASLPTLARSWTSLPRGRDEPVLVLPGFLTGDGATVALRGVLRSLGYDVHGWGLGRNLGNLRKLVPKVVRRIEELHARRQEPVRLIGWSLGGVIAREATRTRPELVDRIITMGTPVVGGPKYTVVASRIRRTGVDLDAIEREVASRNAEPLPVPITVIYSAEDAVVAWRACLDPNPANQVEHIRVDSGHLELGFNPRVFELIANRLR